MTRNHLGDPMELVSMLPKMHALCFDMMGEHNRLPHPMVPLEKYFKTLNDGWNSHKWYNRPIPRNEDFGPWDDIMCYWPEELKQVSCAKPAKLVTLTQSEWDAEDGTPIFASQVALILVLLLSCRRRQLFLNCDFFKWLNPVSTPNTLDANVNGTSSGRCEAE